MMMEDADGYILKYLDLVADYGGFSFVCWFDWFVYFYGCGEDE
jgi:hypothetical protein